MYLNELTPGQNAVVKGYRTDCAIARRLAEMGLIPGREIHYLRDAPLKDPLQIQMGINSLSLRKAQASLIEVDILKE